MVSGYVVHLEEGLVARAGIGIRGSVFLAGQSRVFRLAV